MAALLEKFKLPQDSVAILQAAVEALASKQLLAAERKCLGAERQRASAENKRASAESERASAEKRWGEANAELRDLALRHYKADQVARKRYFELLLLKGSVHLREEINIIEREYAKRLRSENDKAKPSSGVKNLKQKEFSRIDVWAFFFQVNNGQKTSTGTNGEKINSAVDIPIMECCARANRFLTTPRKAAKQMDSILTALNTKFHRALTREEIKASGGIPLVESDTLPLSSCHLLECVFDREAKDTKVYLEGTGPLVPDPILDSVAMDEGASGV